MNKKYINKTINLGLLALFSIIIFSCNKRAVNEKSAQDQESEIKIVQVPNSLSKIFNNKEVFRGTNFYHSSADVKNFEKEFNLVKSNDSNLIYSLDLNENDFVDITYYFKNDTISKIQLDIFASDKEKARTYYQDLSSYFDLKYTKRKKIWESENNEKPFTIFAELLESGIYIVYEII